MTAIVTGRIRVRDAALWQDYVSRVGATIAQYGGEVLFRGTQWRAFSGGAEVGEQLVVLKFADAAAAARWHDSPEYQQLIPNRDVAAEVDLAGYGAAPANAGPANSTAANDTHHN